MSGRSAPGFGATLKRAREQKGLTLRHIATTTKISLAALEALERNDIGHLPGGIFGRGIVRSYAMQVGLDPERTVREFIEQFPTATVIAGSPYVPTEDYQAVQSDRRSARTVLILAGLSVIVVLAILYFTLDMAAR